MLEQLADQQTKGKEIADIRALLKDHNEQFKHQVLVQQFDTDDRVTYRFLRARKFDLPATAELFKKAVALREEKQLDTLLQRPCPLGLEYKVVSKHGWHGFDKHGRPVYLKNTGLQHFPTLNGVGTVEQRLAYNLYITEYLSQVIMPQANERVGHKIKIDQVTTIVNLKEFGFHCIKQHNYTWCQGISVANNILYPETAGTTVLINAPRVFTMVWNIVRKWLDPVTVAKVQILSGDGAKELKSLLGEECYNSLPKEIGGTCECMPASEVPKHAMGCMLGHPQSVAFMEHLRKRNDEAGIPNVYSPPKEVDDDKEVPLNMEGLSVEEQEAAKASPKESPKASPKAASPKEATK